MVKVRNKFEMKTMKDNPDLYLKRDVLLVADVFEIFRNNSLKNCGLCPSFYLTTPALNQDAMLELISDPDLYIFFEKGNEMWSFLHF